MAEQDGLPGIQDPGVLPVINLHVILDVSPSMSIRWPQTISGLNEYFTSLREDQEKEGQDYRVTITSFSNRITVLYDEVVLDAIPTFNEQNLSRFGSGTALYDSVGKTLRSITTIQPVLVLIVTDGEDNSSSTWDEARLSALMDERAKLGNYTYAYLGVGKEAWGNSAKMGVCVAGSSLNMAADAYSAATYKNLGGLTRSYSAGMRSNSMSGAAMNVGNFFSQVADAVDINVSGTTTTTTTPATTPDPLDTLQIDTTFQHNS